MKSAAQAQKTKKKAQTLSKPCTHEYFKLPNSEDQQTTPQVPKSTLLYCKNEKMAHFGLFCSISVKNKSQPAEKVDYDCDACLKLDKNW